MPPRQTIAVCVLALCALLLPSLLYAAPQTTYPMAFPLDGHTMTILTHADRVEVFRLDDFHEHGYYTQAEEANARAHPKFIGDYAIVRQGRTQTNAFARRLAAAMLSVAEPNFLSCFDPGVGFRAWKGRESVGVFACFYCSGIQAVTWNATGKAVATHWASLGAARPLLLALSQEAFPQDARLRALK